MIGRIALKPSKVICEKCNGTIESNGELVTDTLILSVVAHHEHCYSDHLKRGRGFFLTGEPLNGWEANVGFFLAIISAIISLIFFDDIAILFLISLIPIGYRLYSYFVYERLLKD